MAIVCVIAALIFSVLGILGGMTAVSRWWRGYVGLKLLELPHALFFGIALALSALVALDGARVLSGWISLLLMALLPFALLGSVMWVFAFALELFSKAAAPRGMREEPTHDIGDGLMVRRKFAEAEAAYRAYLKKDPLDLAALMRISQAQQADGRHEQAALELEAARRHTIARTDNEIPPRAELLQKLNDKAFRQDRILRLTYALGDLYIEKLGEENRARKLYEESLEILFGYPPADPLRDRLKALNHPERLSLGEAVEKSQPRTISLPE